MGNYDFMIKYEVKLVYFYGHSVFFDKLFDI